MTINPADRDFIISHKVYFDQARMKFLHGFAPGTMDRFYEIYKRYINPGYVLTPWCSECVIDMVSRLGVWYNDLRDQELIAQSAKHYTDQELLSVQAGADHVAFTASLWPEAIDTAPVIIDEEKSAGHSLDAPEKRGKGRPKKKK
jgi:hypothetical protein